MQLAYRFPERTLILLEDRKPFGDLFGKSRLERLEPRRVEGPTVSFTIEEGPGAPALPAWIAVGDRTASVGDDGTVLVAAADVPDGVPTTVTLFLAATPDLATAPFRLEWTVLRVDGQLRTLDEPRPLQYYDFGEGRTATAVTDMRPAVDGVAAAGGSPG